MENISFEDFKKLELKVGRIVSAEKVEKSEKLLKLKIDFGSEERQVISGIAQFYSPEEILEKSFVFVTNLEPRLIMGLESQAMILAAEVEERAVLIAPVEDVPDGSALR